MCIKSPASRPGETIRRPNRIASIQFAFGPYNVDDARRIVRHAGRVVPLRSREYDLLMALVRRGGRIARREELMREVWGYADDVKTRTLDSHVARLRRRLRSGEATGVVLTLRGIGHRLGYDLVAVADEK